MHGNKFLDRGIILNWRHKKKIIIKKERERYQIYWTVTSLLNIQRNLAQMEILNYTSVHKVLISIKDHMSTWDEFHVPVILSISLQLLQLQQAVSNCLQGNFPTRWWFINLQMNLVNRSLSEVYFHNSHNNWVRNHLMDI